MNKYVVLLFLAMALAIVWVGFSFVQSLRPWQEASGTADSLVGVKAPVADFALKDENGKTHHLSDYKGKVVALVFYASW